MATPENKPRVLNPKTESGILRLKEQLRREEQETRRQQRRERERREREEGQERQRLHVEWDEEVLAEIERLEAVEMAEIERLETAEMAEIERLETAEMDEEERHQYNERHRVGGPNNAGKLYLVEAREKLRQEIAQVQPPERRKDVPSPLASKARPES